jgi:hypothetical protein
VDRNGKERKIYYLVNDITIPSKINIIYVYNIFRIQNKYY